MITPRIAAQPERKTGMAHPMAEMLRAVAEVRSICGQASMAAHLEAAADTLDELWAALAAAARKGGDVKQALGEAPQSGGCKPQRPESTMTTLSSHKYSMKGYSGE